nr:phytanoyl-CoA dioxygenase family protein [Pseudomonadota bacterium]
ALDAACGSAAAAAGAGRTVMSYIEADPAFRIAGERLARDALSDRLAGHVEGYRIVSGAIFFKPPGAGEIAVHRDWTQTDNREEVTFSVWCALDDVDEENGALQMVPGSHRLVPAIASLSVKPGFADHADLLKRKSRCVKLQAGEAVIFDSRAIHWSPPNRSGRPRRAAQVVCVPEAARHVFYALDQRSSGARFELIDVSEVGVVQCTPAQILAGARPGPSLGYVENDNRPLPREEFERLLDETVPDAAPAAAQRPIASRAGDPILKVSGLSKKYCPSFRRALGYGVTDMARELLARPARHALRPGEFWALGDLTFDLSPGEAMAVVGHNGAGKTTLLKTLAGLIKPDRGTVRVRGRTRALLELGVEFDPRLSGRENVVVGAAIHGFPSNEVRRLVDAVVDFAELEEFIDAPVQNYSSGMRSRLAYALTAQLNPDILLVDEVLAVGDHAFQRKCVSHMLSYIAQGGTLLLVSHSAHHIQAVCQRGILLDHGRLVFSGSATETLHQMFDKQVRRRREEARASAGASPITITEVLAASPDGGPLQPGQPMRMTLRYRCDEPVNLVWGFTIWTADQWVCVTGSNARREQAIAPGAGELSCLVPRLPLLPGHYVLRPDITDARTTFPLVPGAASSIEIQVASPVDAELNARRQLGQLVAMDVEWE